MRPEQVAVKKFAKNLLRMVVRSGDSPAGQLKQFQFLLRSAANGVFAGKDMAFLLECCPQVALGLARRLETTTEELREYQFIRGDVISSVISDFRKVAT